MQLYPLPRIGFALILGIVFGDFSHAFVPPFVWLSCVVVGLAAYFSFRKRSVVQSMLLFGCVFSLGCWSVNVYLNDLKFIDTKTDVSFQGVVASHPVAHGHVNTFDMWVITDDHPVKIRASIQNHPIESERVPLLGDGLTVCSRIKPVVRYDTLSRFDYVRWAQLHGYRGQTFIRAEKWRHSAVSLTSLSWLQRARLSALKWRTRLVHSLPVEANDSSAMSIVAAMTLGDRSGLDKDTQLLFSQTGASHVLALSGLHLGILYSIFMLLLPRRRMRTCAQVMVISGIWAYVLLTGLPTSLVRSATMFTVMGLVSLTHRSAISLNTLAFTAVIMLVVNPLSLWDIGFQLSFASVFSILLMFQWLESWGIIIRSRVQKAVAMFVILPIAAQIGTFPLVMYHFGLFSCYFLLSNFVAIPATMLILLGVLLSFVVFPFEWLHSLVIQLTSGVVEVLVRFLSLISSLPHATISEIRLSSLQVVLIYSLIVCVLVFIHCLLKAIVNSKRVYCVTNHVS